MQWMELCSPALESCPASWPHLPPQTPSGAEVHWGYGPAWLQAAPQHCTKDFKLLKFQQGDFFVLIDEDKTAAIQPLKGQTGLAGYK